MDRSFEGGESSELGSFWDERTNKEVSSDSLDLYRVVNAPPPSDRPLPFLLFGSEGSTDAPWTLGWIGGNFRVSGSTTEGVLKGKGNLIFVPAFIGIGLLALTLTLTFGLEYRMANLKKRLTRSKTRVNI